MTTPTPPPEIHALAAAVETALNTSPVNVYPYPPSQLALPAVVFRTDSPWRAPSTFCMAEQRWIAVLAVPAGTDSPWLLLEPLARTVETVAQENGWRWTDTGGVFVDESTGSPVLAVAVSLELDAN